MDNYNSYEEGLNIVAVISWSNAGTHSISINRTKSLIKQAHMAGANSVRIQTFDPDKLVLDKDYIMKMGHPWEGENLYELYKKAHMPKKCIPEIFKYAREHVGINIFSSVCDREDIDFLEKLDCPTYKIPSFENTDLVLIRHAAKTGKELIITSDDSVSTNNKLSINVAINEGCKNINLMFSICGYPANDLYGLKQRMTEEGAKGYDGLSHGLYDQSYGLACPIYAVAMGATVIEKNINKRNEARSITQENPIDCIEFCALVTELRKSLKCRKPKPFGTTEGRYNEKLKRSLYYNDDFKEGEQITENHLKTARISAGISPLNIHAVLNKKLGRDVFKDNPVRMCDLYPKIT